MEFTIISGSSPADASTARLGRLAAAGASVVDTPSALVYTRRGIQPHLTNDLLRRTVGGGYGMHIGIHNLVDQPGTTILCGYEGGLKKCLGMPNEALVVAGLRDSLQIQLDGFNGDSFVSIVTQSGRAKLTPKAYADTIKAMRPDIAVSLSDNVTNAAGKKRVRKSVERTLAFLDELLAMRASDPALSAMPVFGVAQGTSTESDRKKSAEETAQRNVDGYVIEGFGSGELASDREAMARATIANIPITKPRMVYGLGTPEEVLDAVSWGVDLFDGFYPVALTEQGMALTFSFAHPAAHPVRKVCLWDDCFVEDASVLLPGCGCVSCAKGHSRAYIHHLLNTHEMLASVLLMSHNLHVYERFFREIRASIANDTFDFARAAFIAAYSGR